MENPDWGLENRDQRDLQREYACLRLQAALLAPYGLAEVLGPTTEHRAYYDGLSQPLEGMQVDAQWARAGMARVDEPPWGPHLRNALRATAQVAALAAAWDNSEDSLWSRFRGSELTQPGGK